MHSKWDLRLLITLRFKLSSSLHAEQKSTEFEIKKGSSLYSFIRWAGETPLGSEWRVPIHLRFPFDGGLLFVLRDLEISAKVGALSLSSMDITGVGA